MKLLQAIDECLKKWADISGLSFTIIDNNNTIVTQTSARELPAENKIEAFRDSDARCVSNTRTSIFKLNMESPDRLLIVYGEQTNASVIGELAVCQIESLAAAYSDQNNKNSFMQNLLLGKYVDTEIYNYARKFKINLSCPRAVYLLRTKTKTDFGIQTMIRNLFSSRTGDFITATDDLGLIIIHEISPAENRDNILETASMLVDMLNMEAMTAAWVACSNPAENLYELPNAYKEAVMTMEVGQIFTPDKNVFSYDRLGIGRLIYQLPDEICSMFIDEIFKEDSIESIDEETLNTIRTFFNNNLNLSETSRQLYVHRNTLVYRFEKLQKKFGLDIRTFEDALTFKLAMMVTDFLKSKKTMPGL